VHKHALSDEDACVESADRLQPNEAVVIDVFDQKANLIHVRGDHDPRPAAAPSRPHYIAQNVNRKVIDERPQLFDDYLPRLILSTRDTRRLA
jgi:hypothetical protein